MIDFKEVFYREHDVVCNQKYGDNLPYSFHLKCVVAQAEKFIHLIPEGYIHSDERWAINFSYRQIVLEAAAAHDSIEDARMSYNNVVEVFKELQHKEVAETIANIVYCVTDDKGKSRSSRKNDTYYSELKANKLAVYVKLCDIAANTLYSKLTNSGMYKKYKEEFRNVKSKIYLEEYDELFTYIENL